MRMEFFKSHTKKNIKFYCPFIVGYSVVCTARRPTAFTVQASTIHHCLIFIIIILFNGTSYVGESLFLSCLGPGSQQYCSCSLLWYLNEVYLPLNEK